MQTLALVIFSIVSFHATTMPAHRAAHAGASRARIAVSGDSTTQKVWSNDDIKFLRENAPISLFRPASTPEPAVSAAANAPTVRRPYVKELDPDWYADEIAARREDLESVDAQLAQIAYTEKTGEGTTDEFPLDKSSPGILLPGTIQVLQADDQELRSEVDSLQDLGRIHDIPPAATR
jgi:hypothetical protein